MSRLKPNIPRSWYSLPKREQEAIVQYQKEVIDELTRINVDHEEAELQKTWLKMGCIVNYDMSGYGSRRARQWLFRWKRLYRKIASFKTAAERDAFLDAKMEKIFGRGGYPAAWVDSLEDRGEQDG